MFRLLLLASSVLILFAACSIHRTPELERVQVPRAAFKPGDIIETEGGSIVSFEDLADELSRIKVIYVGEMHTSVEDHRIQLELLKALFERNPSIVLALEMFPRDHQLVLDQYSRGALSEEVFLKKSRWEKVWGYPFGLYRDILEFAQGRNLKILGLNAPPEIVRKIGRAGLSSLTRKERSRVADVFHLEDPRHREYVLEHYKQHFKGDIKDFDSFYEAQLAWEETMAETLASRLELKNEGEQVLVLIGAGHISDRMGVPELTAERTNHSYRTVVPVQVNDFNWEKDSKIGDFIWFTERSMPFHRGRLGIMIRPLPTGDGIEVLHVVEDSPAEKAGIEKGDIIYMVDGTPLGSMEEFHKAIAREISDHTLSIRRNGEDISINISR